MGTKKSYIERRVLFPPYKNLQRICMKSKKLKQFSWLTYFDNLISKQQQNNLRYLLKKLLVKLFYFTLTLKKLSLRADLNKLQHANWKLEDLIQFIEHFVFTNFLKCMGLEYFYLIFSKQYILTYIIDYARDYIIYEILRALIFKSLVTRFITNPFLLI